MEHTILNEEEELTEEEVSQLLCDAPMLPMAVFNKRYLGDLINDGHSCYSGYFQLISPVRHSAGPLFAYGHDEGTSINRLVIWDDKNKKVCLGFKCNRQK